MTAPRTPQTAPMPELGRYEVRGQLGAGAMASVYRAFDPLVGREVAIKLLARASPLYGDDSMRERFRQEAQAVGRLSHPGVVAIYDFGEADDGDYLVMELVDGESLASAAEKGRMAFQRVAEMGAAIARVLSHAHRAGVVHRDVKPANVIVLPDGRVKLLDFGLAKLPVGTHTQTGVLMGTPRYMAPEYLLHGDVLPAGDQFALGVVLHELLTGQPPFDADDFAGLMRVVATQPHADLTQVVPGLPRELSRVVDRALQKEPDKRFPSCDAFAEALEGLFQSSRPVESTAHAERELARLLVERGLIPEGEVEGLIQHAADAGLVAHLRQLRAVQDGPLLEVVARWLGAEPPHPELGAPQPTPLVPLEMTELLGVIPLGHDRVRKELRVAVPAERAARVLPALISQVGDVALRIALAWDATLEPIRKRLLASRAEPGAARRRVLAVAAGGNGTEWIRAVAKAAGDRLLVVQTREAASALVAPGLFDVVVASGLEAADLELLRQRVERAMPDADLVAVDPRELMLGERGLSPAAWLAAVQALGVTAGAGPGSDALQLAATAEAVARKLQMGAGRTARAVALTLACAADRQGRRTGRASGFIEGWTPGAFPAAGALAVLLKGQQLDRAPREAQIALVVELWARALEAKRAPAATRELLRTLPARSGVAGAVVEALIRIAMPEQLSEAEVPLESGHRVLVADPDAAARDRAVRVLREAGIEVESVRDGAAALERVKEGGIDLVLAEVLLPVRDGLGLTLALDGAAPVLLWSGRVDATTSTRALKLGAQDLIAKDVPDELLRAKVERILDSGRRRP